MDFNKAESSKVTEINGGHENPNGYDVDENGKIIAIGQNVTLWITKGDIEAHRVSDSIPKDQIKYYSNGNPSGDESHSDVFLLHQNSGYLQDGEFRGMNSITGNTTSASGQYGDARDTIYVQDDGKGWGADKGPANVNGNINYVDNVSVTIGDKTIVQGSNHISDVTSSEGGSGWDPNAPISHTSWHYELSLDASIAGGGGKDQITSITLSGLPKGSIEFNGKPYSVDANGHVVIDVDDSVDLSAKITINTGNSLNLGDIKVDITTSVNGELHESGDIALNDAHHSITLSGEDPSTHQQSHDTEMMAVSIDEHHDLNEKHGSHDVQLQNEGLEGEGDHQSYALLLDSEDLYLIPTSEPDDTVHNSPTSATMLGSEEQLNFSDIIHDEGNDNDLSKFLPVADVRSESHHSPDHIVAVDAPYDGGDAYTGDEQAQMDNLIAKPDIDA